MKCCLIQSGEKILTAAIANSHRGEWMEELRWCRLQVNEVKRKIKLETLSQLFFSSCQ